MREIVLVSDSDCLPLQTVLSHYNSHLTTDYNVNSYSYVRELEELKSILTKIYYEKPLFVYAVANSEHSKLIKKFCKKHSLECVNIFKDYSQFVNEDFLFTQEKTELDDEYYNRVECIEFAIDGDDGKSYSKILQADIVIIGISRTGKTPLSMFLALRGFKVVNIPLFEGMQIPKELYKVPKRRVFGLVNSVDNLLEIRMNRVNGHKSMYTNNKSILNELNFAYTLYGTLNCDIINTDNLAVEEIAHYIENIVKEKK